MSDSKKVQIILPNGKKGGWHTIGNTIRLKGEGFLRRINSDGTLTIIPNKVLNTIKTKSGKILRIEKDSRNNLRLYSDNKFIENNFTLKDGNSEYIVDDKGVLRPTILNGREVMKTTFPSNWRESIIPVKELTPLTSIINKIQNLAEKSINRRYNIELQYFVPLGIPGIKFANVSTGSRFNGVMIPYNLLDSVAKYSKQVPGFTLEDGLGLLGETSSGLAPVAHLQKPVSIRTSLKYPDYLLYKSYGNLVVLGYYPTDITNNHLYYLNNPASSFINTLIRLGKLDGVVGTFGPTIKWNQQYDLDVIDNANYWYPKLLLQDLLYSDNPWINAFQYLLNENYGMGSNYPKLNRALGRELLNDPEIKEWYKQSSYTK